MQSRWIFLALLTIHLLCTAEVNVPQILGITLFNTFGYEFIDILLSSDVIFWNISNEEQSFQPQKYIKNITRFESTKTYLIFTQTQSGYFSIYYWLGCNTQLDEKKAAAKNATLFYTLFKEYKNSRYKLMNQTSISREVEAMESESFHNTINFVNRTGKGGRQYLHHMYVDREYISQYPNLYVVRGETTTRIKKVPVSTSWFISDTCLVMETGCKIDELTPLNMFCGSTVSEKAKIRAEEFIDNHYLSYESYIGQHQPLLIFDNTNRCDPKFKVFVEVLENGSNYKSHEVDESKDHLKDAATFVADRDKAVKLFWIKSCTIKVAGTNDIKHVLKKCEDEGRPVFTPHFAYQRETGIGFIFDSSSIAGLFVHIRSGNNTGEKIAIMEIVEDYIEEKYSFNSLSPRVRIRESYYDYNVIDLMINMVTWPINDDMQQAHEYW